MTVQELKEELNKYDDNLYVVIEDNANNAHYEISDSDLGYDDDYESDVVILYS